MNAIVNMPIVSKTVGTVKTVYDKLDFLSPLSNLIIRLWIANVFFKSGMLKYNSWDSTMYLFEYEYEVPLLSPQFAAVLGTSIELFFPVLLALGLMGRFSAFVLFVFNIMAVISYPALQAAGIQQHQIWGIMLLVPLLYGPGKLSIDHFIKKKFNS